MSHHQTSLFLAHPVLSIKVDRVASVIHNTVRGRVGGTKKKYNKILKNFRHKAFFYLCLPDDLHSIYRVSDEIQEIPTVIFSLRNQIAENRVGRHIDDQTADMST